MRVLRGAAGSIDADRAVTERMHTRAGVTGEPAVRVWKPPRQVAFGRRDANTSGYERARRAASEHGYPPIERSVGGRAVAYEGSTVSFARAYPIDDLRSGIGDRYDDAAEAVTEALAAVGVDAERGEPERSFCPGAHSLSADGRKVAGIAQRVTADAALVGGIVLPRERWSIAEVLADVYDALDAPFDPGTVGSVRAAGGNGEPDALVEALEAALVDGRSTDVERVTG